MSKETAKPLDLAQFDAAIRKQDEGILVPIMGMDGKTPLGFSIRIAGPDSDRARAAGEAMTDELIESENIGRLSAKQSSERGIRYLAKVTIGWEPYIVIDGKEMAYSEENAVMLYQRFAFIKEQLDRKGGRAAFLKE